MVITVPEQFNWKMYSWLDFECYLGEALIHVYDNLNPLHLVEIEFVVFYATIYHHCPHTHECRHPLDLAGSCI